MEAAIIKETGWSYDQLCEAPCDWVGDMVGAWNAQAVWENRQIEKARNKK